MIEILFIVLMLVLANLPFFVNRILFFRRLADGQRKHAGHMLLELAVIYMTVLLIAQFAERQLHGQAYDQRWEFYTVLLCLLLVCAFPGYVARYLWKAK